MKIEFLDQDNFIICCRIEQKLITEEELKKFFKKLNQYLKKNYDYAFNGLYNVIIHCNHPIYVMEFKNVDDYGMTDFDITVLLNSILLYEFEMDDWLNGSMIYYNDKFYVEVELVKDDIHFFEYGKIIYGTQIEEILNKGVIITN